MNSGRIMNSRRVPVWVHQVSVRSCWTQAGGYADFGLRPKLAQDSEGGSVTLNPPLRRLEAGRSVRTFGSLTIQARGVHEYLPPPAASTLIVPGDMDLTIPEPECASGGGACPRSVR
jgi:hypothetical protein